MSRGNDKTDRLEFDRARDELFSHIHRCGVLRATEEQQTEWMEDTVEYMAERFTALTREDLAELRSIGLRFCRPVIDNVQATEVPAEDTEDDAGTRAVAA